MSAVSIRFTPASSAILICRRAPSRSVAPTLLKLPRPPNVIVPIVSFEMRRPDRPSCRYSIRALLVARSRPRVYGRASRVYRSGEERATRPPRRGPGAEGTDLAARVAPLELAERVADVVQRVDARDRHLEPPLVDQLRQLGQHVDARGGGRPLHLDPVLRARLPVDDRVDPVGRHAQLVHCERYVARSERVDECVDLALGDLTDAVGDAVAVGDRDRAVLEQPLVVGLAGETDHGGAGDHGELHGERPDAARGSGHDHGVAGPSTDRAHGGVRGRAGDEQRAGGLPRDSLGLSRQLVDGHDDELGVARSLIGPSEHRLVDLEPARPRARAPRRPRRGRSPRRTGTWPDTARRAVPSGSKPRRG